MPPEHEPEAGNATPDVESLVIIIEKLRKRRIATIDAAIASITEAIEQLPSPKPRALERRLQNERRELRARRRDFSIDTINVNGLHCLKNLRSGKVQYPPPRRELLDLAEYLGCSPLERNRLLLSVGYQPLQVLLKGVELEAALIPQRRALNYLPAPGFIINRDWSVLGTNAAFYRFFDVPLDVIDLAMTNGHANVLRMIFDRNYPFYDRLNPTGKDDDPAWQALAAANVRYFKQQNYLSWEEPWYTNVRDSLANDSAAFLKIWNLTNIDTPIPEMSSTEHTFPIFRPSSPAGAPPLMVTAMHIMFGDVDHPQIFLYMPADDEARHAFKEIGLPVPENGWHLMEGR